MLTAIAIILLALFALGIPVAMAMGMTATAAILLRGDLGYEVIAQRFVTGVDSFPLLAVHFSFWPGPS